MSPVQSKLFLILQQCNIGPSSQRQVWLAQWTHVWSKDLLVAMMICCFDVSNTLLLHCLMRVFMCNGRSIEQSLDCMLAALGT